MSVSSLLKLFLKFSHLDGLGALTREALRSGTSTTSADSFLFISNGMEGIGGISRLLYVTRGRNAGNGVERRKGGREVQGLVKSKTGTRPDRGKPKKVVETKVLSFFFC